MGSFFIVKTQDFINCGMMDPNTFLYAEEIILSEKLKKINKQVYYFPSVTVLHEHGQTTSMHLNNNQMQKEKFTQRTAVGIHKDEFSFFMDGKPIRDYASQGQLKSYIFGLKLAQYAYLKDHTGKSPLLLLDDVFDKLDQGRVARLLALITGLDFGQIFITDTHQGRAVQLLPTHMEVEEFVIRDGAILSHH